MRWYALNLWKCRKDLIESAILSTKIIKLIGKNNPGFAYELFWMKKVKNLKS